MEKGAEYGMAGKVDTDDNGVMLEWDAQAKAFEEYTVGKTVADIKAMTTQEKKGHQITTDADLLAAGCSMQITDFIDAVVKACEDTQGMSFQATGFRVQNQVLTLTSLFGGLQSNKDVASTDGAPTT